MALSALQHWATQSNKKRVYHFNEGNLMDEKLLGNKGASLSELTRMGLPVPLGFTITTEAALEYLENGKKISENIMKDYTQAIHDLERQTGLEFGSISSTKPLLIAIRCGSTKRSLHHGEIVETGCKDIVSIPESWSIPGLSPTFLNVGLTDQIVQCRIIDSYNHRNVLNSYLIYLMNFGVHVLGIDQSKYNKIIDDCSRLPGGSLDIGNLEFKLRQFKKLADIPADPWTQLKMIITSIYDHWFSDKAMKYRKTLDNLPDDLGVAICIQVMIRGNSSFRSGTGYCFSRDPTTGENKLHGEFVFHAEGEEVITGKRITFTIEELGGEESQIFQDISKYMRMLESHHKDMQDVEFALDVGELYILQSRSGQRTASASLKIAIDMVNEGLLTQKEAIIGLDIDKLSVLLDKGPDINQLEKRFILEKGNITSSSGIISGRLAFTLNECQQLSTGQQTIPAIVYLDSKVVTDEIEEMINLSVGVITSNEDLRASEIVLCRAMGKACVAGVKRLKAIIVNNRKSLLSPDGTVFNYGDTITIDGSSGCIYKGLIQMSQDKIVNENLETVVNWADCYRNLRVTLSPFNFDDMTSTVIEQVEGIGYMRTEFLFQYDSERLDLFQQIILSSSVQDRQTASSILMNLQKEDLKHMLRAMDKKHVCISLLDSSLQMFLPSSDTEYSDVSQRLNVPLSHVRNVSDSLRDTNPIIGMKGCRISAIYPEITKMQVEAIIGAALVVGEEGPKTSIEILIPTLSSTNELESLHEFIQKTADEVINTYLTKGNDTKSDFRYMIGVLIDNPRACLRSAEFAKYAYSFCFDLQKLTELTYGISKFDSRKFMATYLSKHYLQHDPFLAFDKKGVGALIRSAIIQGRENNPNLYLSAILGDSYVNYKCVAYLHDIGVQAIACRSRDISLVKLGVTRVHILTMSDQRTTDLHHSHKSKTFLRRFLLPTLPLPVF